MKGRYFYILFVVVISLVLSVSAEVKVVRAQQADESVDHLQKATLLSHIKYDKFATSVFNFAVGARVDSKLPLTHNEYDLHYGGFSDNGDQDWFEVPSANGSRSQLKDLGEMSWADIYYVPVLPASLTPHPGGISHSYKAGKMVSTSPEGVLVKAVAGHLYLLHSKHDKTDLYVMFRIDALKDGDECTISWKVVPSPEGEQP
jgi:hypothetical protein